MRGPQDDDLVPLHQPFEPELRGFNRRQVLEHLESLDGRIAMVAADRDTALTQVTELSKVLNHLRLASEDLRREADKATARVERILATPMAGANARIQRIMRLAEEEAAELAAHAEAEVAELRARADQDIAERRARADEEITRLRTHASREAKSLLDHARRQRHQLETDSAARRRATERDAAQAIAHRESAASARIRDSERRSIAGLRLMVHAINEQLSTRARTVERDESALRELRAQIAGEVAELEALRTEVTAALATVHQRVTEALGQVQGAPGPASAGEPPDAPAPVPIPLPMPIQRTTAGGTVYLLNTGTEELRSPRTSR